MPISPILLSTEALDDLNSFHKIISPDIFVSWLDNFKNIVSSALSTATNPSPSPIQTYLDGGASAYLITLQPLILAKMLPLAHLSTNFGNNNPLTNPDCSAPAKLNWVINHFTWRNTAIWDYNPYTTEQPITRTSNPQDICADSTNSNCNFATSPATESTCLHGKLNCPSYIANWLNPDSDTELLCDALCKM
ncbi:unnamed protein product [Oikopleura dioica]|uniref:Uncharacterized protein n=1 Tax=Oikopleura dioica TaxID=34765 RepID=E4XX81_OIKDI|nr:unnamed protein product [Oikopleura dioica]